MDGEAVPAHIECEPCHSWGKVRSERAAEHSPILVTRSWKSTAISLHTLWPTLSL